MGTPQPYRTTDMADNTSRRGAADLGMLLMIVAFIVIGLFMYYLNVRAAEERALAIVEESDTADEMEVATTVAATDLEVDAGPFEGRLIRVSGLNVASMLGTQGFWLELPNGQPFLISMSEEVKAEGVAITMGERATVTGIVHAVNDSALNAWTTTGAIGDGDRLAAEFAMHYLESTEVVVADTTSGEGNTSGN